MYFLSNYYYLILGLQGFCVYHSYKRGTHQKWIWLIVFLPLVGSLIYLYSEVWGNHSLSHVQNNIGQVVNPSGKMRNLERKLKFSNTFENKVALADAYMVSRMHQQAIDLYESCREGIFADNEYLIIRLMEAYYPLGRYEEIIGMAEKVKHTLDFRNSNARTIYALSLEKAGHLERAETEFMALNGNFSNFEARYYYGQFLIRSGRTDEAQQLYRQITNEEEQMNGRERRYHKAWLNKVREEYKG